MTLRRRIRRITLNLRNGVADDPVTVHVHVAEQVATQESFGSRLQVNLQIGGQPLHEAQLHCAASVDTEKMWSALDLSQLC